jgi:hypothetical protein
MRTFTTGATRDADTHKIVPTGCTSPLVELRFAQYMHAHREQKDGTLRAPDNWRAGIPQQAYLESLGRHFLELRLRMDRDGGDLTVYPEGLPSLTETLCALRFNVDGLLHEILLGRDVGEDRR